MKVFFLLLLLSEYYIITRNAKIELFPTMKTKHTDVMPKFLNDQPHGKYIFAVNFSNLTDIGDIPRTDFLKKKSVTHFLTNTMVTGKILPIAEYQAIYIFVTSGEALIDIKMCPEGIAIRGGTVTNGWNIVALHFPTLLKMARCHRFDWDIDRPIFELHGSGFFSVWQKHYDFVFKVSETLFRIEYAIASNIICMVYIFLQVRGLFVKDTNQAAVEAQYIA